MTFEQDIKKHQDTINKTLSEEVGQVLVIVATEAHRLTIKEVKDIIKKAFAKHLDKFKDRCKAYEYTEAIMKDLDCIEIDMEEEE